MTQEMLINVRQQEECRIAVVEDGSLEELYVERTSHENYVGNIYKGIVVNIEPSIQAAFIDFGVGRNGFLHISDVEPHYFKQAGFTDHLKPQNLEPRHGRFHHHYDDMGYGRPRVKPPIQDVFRRGDEILVQVIKEGLGTKGPTLSTYISIPGRYLVLMPSLGRVGVSRKIEDDDVRRKLRDIMNELKPPKGLGFIVRTAGAERTRKELARDLSYLVRLWTVIVNRIKKMPAPIDIYEESDMIIRTIRDIFTGDIDSIVVDEQSAYERAKEFMQVMMPRYVDRISLYSDKEPLFFQHGIDREISRMNRRRVSLAKGGSIVIDQTEALVAIDVNSGNYRADDNAEETAFQINMIAAKEIARQLRLRDLGGVIVNDFIDMRKDAHRRAVERELRNAVKRDRSRTKILRTSPFGLIEMTRQRVRPSLKRSVFIECPCCRGVGVVKSVESMGLDIFRILILAASRDDIKTVKITVTEEVAEHLNNRKRNELAKIETDGNIQITIKGLPDVWPEHLEVECLDAMEQPVMFSWDNPLKGKPKPVQ